MMTDADMIIFRVPPPEGESGMFFVKIDYHEGMPDDEGRIFSVGEGSTYNIMEWNHVVVAKAVEGGSQDLGWFLISDDDGGPQTIHEMDADDMIALIIELMDNYVPNLDDIEACEVH